MPTRCIELLKPHTHAGKRLAVGDLVELNDIRAQWLVDHGVAKATTANAATPTGDSKPARRDATPGATHTTQGD